MNVCSCYIKHPWADKYGYCSGTKNRDLCYCQGNQSKCDFYPENRERTNKKMTTLEMMNLAKENGKTYISSDLFYNTRLGFHNEHGNPVDGDIFYNLNELFSIDDWQEDNTIYMTKSEAEKKYGIKIVGD